jgi:hypothetical protein
LPFPLGRKRSFRLIGRLKPDAILQQARAALDVWARQNTAGRNVQKLDLLEFNDGCWNRPLRGREFFEEIIRDNLDLGRPDRVQ